MPHRFCCVGLSWENPDPDVAPGSVAEYPFRYASWLNRRKVALVLTAVWAVALLVTTSQLLPFTVVKQDFSVCGGVVINGENIPCAALKDCRTWAPFLLLSLSSLFREFQHFALFLCFLFSPSSVQTVRLGSGPCWAPRDPNP